MNKTEFLEKVRSGLGGIPQKDINERLAFYSEMIDDRIEDGIAEEEAVAQTGSADEIIAQIVSDYPLNKLVKEKIRPERRLRSWEIVLIVLGFPLWLPLLITGFAVVFSVYVCILAVIVSLWAVFVSLAAGSLAAFAAAVIFFIRGFTLQALALLGAGLFLAGFSILFFIICRAATKGIFRLSGRAVFALKSRFIRKEASK